MTVAYIFQFFGIMLLAAPFYALARWLVLRHRWLVNEKQVSGKQASRKQENRMQASGKRANGKLVNGRNAGFHVAAGREIFMGLFFLYVIGLLALALILGAEYASPAEMAARAGERIRTGEGINLVPFRTISAFGRRAFGQDIFFVNIVGNIIMFFPWGFGLVFLWKRNRTIPRIVLWSALLPLFIETWQLFVGRSVDVDDWILNFIGSVIGGLVGLIWMRRRDG